MKSFIVILFCLFCTGCTRSPVHNATSNPYCGTWDSVYVYKSGYTNDYFMPIPLKNVAHSMTISADGSYEQMVTLVYADDSSSITTFKGTYTYTDSEITIQPTEGAAGDKTIPRERLPGPETYIRNKRTFTAKDVYYSESPERDENNQPKYPIILSFRKRSILHW